LPNWVVCCILQSTSLSSFMQRLLLSCFMQSLQKLHGPAGLDGDGELNSTMELGRKSKTHRQVRRSIDIISFHIVFLSFRYLLGFLIRFFPHFEFYYAFFLRINHCSIQYPIKLF
jgi:hypothetical protein